jgi:hypothetical protein
VWSEICALFGSYWLKLGGALVLEAKICNLDHFLVNLLGNLGFYCLIILGEVSKSAILHFIVNVMVYLLIHVKDYEIACLTNPRSKELKLLLLCSSFARHLPR